MIRVRHVSFCLFLGLVTNAYGRGVSPYVPLQLDPEMERKIERLLILADKPVMTRPLAAATVLDALPRACRRDPDLCEEVRRYLAVYMHDAGVAHAGIKGGYTKDDGSERPQPNQYGQTASSAWQASLSSYWQPSDYLLASLGGTAFDGDTDPTGSMVSLGFSVAQLDLGYRSHWLSPMTDSSMLISTEAPTMPSVTLSNYVPATRFGFKYELFLARMSESDRIAFRDGFTEGKPGLFGFHLSMEPVSGWSLGINRLMQYGGGDRGGTSISTLFRAFFRPGKFDTANEQDEQSGNQVGSITTRFIFPGTNPFSVYFEYAGEDSSRGGSISFGNSSLGGGIDFPRLWGNFDLTYEMTEWQNAWYVHHIFQDGLVNDGLVLGHWGADQRVFIDGVGARSQMLRIGWRPEFGGTFDLRYRSLQNQSYGVQPYERASEVTLRYSRPWQKFNVGIELTDGQDVFGQDTQRAMAFARYTGAALSPYPTRSGTTHQPGRENGAELFVDAGVHAYRVQLNADAEIPETTSGTKMAPHLGIGARRAVSENVDLGVRAEVDDLNGDMLLAVRAIDFRYRFRSPFAASAFLGAARLSAETPAIGVYMGVGGQWRNALPGWDVGAEFRWVRNAARDRVLPTDPPGIRPDIFRSVLGATISVTRLF